MTAVTSSQISLARNDVIEETGFRIERSPAETTNWTAVGVAAQDHWVFTDNGLAASTAYSYRVIATGRNRDSLPSAVVTAATTAPSPPATPVGVAATAVSPSQIDVSWQNVAGETSYRVQRSTDGMTGWRRSTQPAKMCSRSPTQD